MSGYLRALRWAVVAMTGIAAGVAVYEAAFGDDVGYVVVSLVVAIAGVFVIALTGDRMSLPKGNSDHD